MLCSSLVCTVYLYCVFFKQKTAYEMRISDWSSDVCSSDLAIIVECDGYRAQAERAYEEQHGDVTRILHAYSVPGPDMRAKGALYTIHGARNHAKLFSSYAFLAQHAPAEIYQLGIVVHHFVAADG